MNTFRVDDLVLTFDELKPFSEVLHDETQIGRLHKIYKNLDKYDDASLLRHVLVLVSFMENALQADPPLTKALQNHLIEFTSLIERAKSGASKNYINLAMGILFKYSGALLHVQKVSDAEVSLMLYCLAYHHLSSFTSTEPEVLAWVTTHLLETTAAITYNDVSEGEITTLWGRDDLAEFCVDSLIPSEGHIQRLHASVYREGIHNCSCLWPAVTVKRIRELFDRLVPVLHRPEVLRVIVWMIGHDGTFEEMSLFDDLLSKSPVGKSVEFDSSNLTSIDVKVFLYTLSLWSDSVMHPAKVPERLRIRADQANCWKAMCHLINRAPEADSLKSVLLRSRVIDSVRLRNRVIGLRRLYEVFRWLEANVDDESWLTLYASTISDTITGTYPCRRKCDDVFPDGTGDDEDIAVDEVDSIEEHVSRYLASRFLQRGEFGEAERRLVFANSTPSKRLLIKVYQSWLEDGRHLDDHEREQLSKRVKQLEADCHSRSSHENTPTSASPVSVESAESPDIHRAAATLPVVRKLQVDASTNTPTRADTSMFSAGGDDSFFSVRSERTDAVASDRSFASAIASPFGSKPQTSHEAAKAQEANDAAKPAAGQPTSVLSMTDSHSVSISIPAPRAECNEKVALPDLSLQQSSASPKNQAPMAPVSVSVSTCVSPKPGAQSSILTNSPLGKFITSKEAATSFWKSGKPVTPVFGAVPPCLSSGQQKGSGQQTLTNPVSSTAALNSPRSAPHLPSQSTTPTISSGTQPTFSSQTLLPTASGAQDQKGFATGGNSPISFRKPQAQISNPLSPCPNTSVIEESPEDDESFCNNLMMEICRKQLQRSSKVPQSDNVDLGELQEKMSRMKVQMKNVENQLDAGRQSSQSASATTTKSPAARAELSRLSGISTTTTRSPPTQAELLREQQRLALAELEQRVLAQVMSAPKQPQAMGASGSLTNRGTGVVSMMPAVGSITSAPQPAGFSTSSQTTGCVDPMGLFRGLLNASGNTAKPPSGGTTGLAPQAGGMSSFNQSQSQLKSLINPLQKMEQLACHPGSTGVCLGCLDDDAQDRALKALERLADEWNRASDSDDE